MQGNSQKTGSTMIPFLHKIRKLVISVSAGTLVLVAMPNVMVAEGTKQVRPDSTVSGGSLMIDWNNPMYTRFGCIGCPANYRLYIHIKNVGETILFGLQTPVANVGYNLRRPNGTIAMTGNLPTAGAGYIRYYRNAIQGPFPAFSGYTPLIQKINSIADTGDWYFEIRNIPNGGTAEFRLFDFQVVTGLNLPALPNDTINGRVWSQSWQFYADLGGNNGFDPFNGSVYIYSDDGITTKLRFSGVHWGEGTIFCNPVGCTNTGNFPVDRQSSNNNTYATFPGIAWYKVFLNDPDTIVYPNGEYGRVTKDPTMIDDPNYPVCSGKKYIEVVVNKKGSIIIKIDVPYGDSTYDLTIDANVNPGLNHIPWNGLDGHGGQVPAGTWLELTVTFINGLTNLPLWDIEQNPLGYKVDLIRPKGPTLSEPLIYWDDSQLKNDGTCPNAPTTVNLAGCVPTTSICHDWAGIDCHDKMINSWWFSGSTSTVPLWVYYSKTPDNPVPFSETRCGPGIDTLHVTVVPAFFTADWYSALVGGNLLLSGSKTFITPSLNATTTFYALTRDSISGCISARVPVTVTVLPLPVMPVTLSSNPSVLCFNQAGTITLNATGGFGTTIRWFAGSCGTTEVGTGTTLVLPSPAVTTTYYARWENNCGLSACNSVTVSIQDAILSGSIAPDQTICQGGDPVTLTSPVPGSGSGVITYRWERFPGAGPWTVINGATGDTYDPPAGLMITTLYRRIAISTLGGVSCESQPTATVTVTVNTVTPGMVGSDQQICSADDPASFTELAGATGSGIRSFQWQSNTSGCAGPWSDIPGAISNTYNPPPGLSQTTYFHRLVTFNLNGVNCSAVSGCLTIIVLQTPDVTASPSSQVICSKGTTGIALSSSLPNTTFTWTTGIVPAGSITGSSAGSGNNIIQTLTNTTFSPATITYTITPTANGCPGLPISIVVTVNPTPNAIASPAAQTICSGGTTGINLSGNIVTTIFAWTVAIVPAGSVTGTSAGSGNNIIQTLVNTTFNPATVSYTVTPTANGCPGPPISVVVTVDPTPNAIAAPAAQTICSGGTTGINLSGNTPTTTFAWTESTIPAGSVTGTSAGSGNKIIQTLTNTTFNPATVTYTITPTANGCPGPPVSVVETVNPAPNAIATPAAQTICSGGTTGINLSGNTAGTSFAWSVAIIPAGSVIGSSAGNGNTIIQTLTNTTFNPATVTYTITPTANGCPGLPISIAVTINPTPNAIATPAALTICSSGTTGINLSSNTLSTTFAWTVAAVPAGSVTGISAGNGNNIIQTLTNTTFAPAIVTYTITPTANGCQGLAISVVVTVNPTPDAIAIPAIQTICSGGTTGINLSSNTVTTTFTWTTSIVPAGSITGSSAGSGNNIIQTLTNTTFSPATITYTITPTANGCPGIPISIVVTVDPTPNAIASPAVQTICSGGTTGINLSGNIVTTTFSWTVTIVPAGSVTGTSAGSGNNILQALTNTTFAPAIVTYTITPTANGCPGPPISVVVTVDPIPNALAAPSLQTICSGGNTGISLSGNTPGTTFTWTVASSPAGSIGGASPGSGNTIAQVLINTTPDPSIVTYTITPSANGCPGLPITVVVTVNPSPNVNATPALQTICSTGTSDIILSGTTANTGFSWTIAVLPAGSISGASNGSGNTISQTLVNNTASPATVAYTIVPTANGCTGIPINAVVTVNPLPVPSITGPSNVCINSTGNLYSTEVGMTNYNWTITGGSITGGAGTNTITVTWNLAGLHPVGITYTDLDGCNPAIPSVMNVNVISLVASVTGTNVPCYGDNNGTAFVTVTGGNGGYTYLWNDPLVQTTNPATNLAPGTYTVLITDATLCTLSRSVTIIQEHPTPSAALSVTGGDKICQGNSVTLRVDLTGTPPWSLTISDGNNSTTINGIMSSPYTIQVYPANTCIYTVIALTDLYCTAVPGMMTGSGAVTVYPLPPVEYEWNTTLNNYEIQFHIDSSIVDLGAVGYMVLWNFGDGTFGYGHNPLHLYPGSTTFDCMLTVTDTNGCSNSIMHEIFVPPVQIAFYSSNSPTCLGTPMCFQDLSTVPNPPATYIKTWVWDFGDGTPPDTIHFPDNPDRCHTYSATGNYTVTLTIRDNWGTTFSYSHDQHVIPVPIAGFTYSTNCEGQPVQFTDVSSINGSVNIISWNWDFDDPISGIYNTSNLQNPSHTFTTGSTIYNVRLIIQNFNGCIDTLIRLVYILPKPPVEFTHDSACNEQIVHFVADAGITHIDSIVTWSWDFGDGSVPSYNPVTAMHTYPAPGTYIATLTLTDHHGCFNSVSHGVRVNPLPVPVFSWSTPTCSGSPVHFTDNSTVPSGYSGYIAKWLWEFGDGTSQLVVLPGSPDVNHTFVGPGMTHTVRLTVWTSDSCSQFVEYVIESVTSPVADFNFSAIHCTDQPVQFTDLTNINGGGGISQWNWNFGDPTSGINNTSSLQNPVHTFNNAGSYPVKLIVTNLNGCVDTIVKIIDVNATPVADFHSDTVCLHVPTQFTNLSSSNVPAILSYSWDFGDGSALSNLQNPTHTYALSGIFNVTLSIVNSNGCSKDTTKAVLVNPLPIVAFSFSSPNCFGAAVQYTDFSTTVPGYLGSIVKWVWEFGDGTLVTILAPANPDVSHTFVGTALSHVVRLTVTTSDGCTDNKEHTVNSIPSPIASFTYAGTSCTAQSVQFTDLSQPNGGGAVFSWFWNFNDPASGTSNTSSAQNPVHFFTGTGLYHVSLIVVTVNNCTDTVVRTIMVNSSPQANFAADTACLHQPTQFDDLSIPNAAGIISYSWNFGDGSPLSNLQNPVHTYSTYGVKNVTLTIINSNGCVKDTTKQAMVRPLPMAEFIFSTENCKGTPVQFTDASTTIPGYPASIVQWVWNFGDGTPPVTIIFPGNPNVIHSFTGSANAYAVRLTVTTSDGCSDFIEHIVNTIASPAANFTYPASSCSKQPVQFTDISQSNGGSNITQWHWNFGDPVSGNNNISALQNPGHIFTAPGTYNVSEIISNFSGCQDTVMHTITVIPLPVADFTADTACLGLPTTFINQSTSSVGSITQQLWEFGDGTTSTAVNPVHTYPTYGIYHVRLTVTTQDGCIKDTTKSLQVMPIPVVSFNATGPTCLGDSVDFTDNSFAMYGAIQTWQWDYGDGTVTSISVPVSPDISHLYPSSGTYSVILRVITYNGCTATSTMLVPVQPAPAADYIYSSARCVMSPVQFTNISQPNGGTPVTQWLWDFNDPGSGASNTSNIPNPVHTFSGSGTYNVTLTITSVDGCFNSITKAVSINTKPIAQFSSDTACAGSATQFMDSSVPNAPAISSWYWNFGDPLSGTNDNSIQQNPMHIYSNSGNYFVTLEVTNSNGCGKDTLMMLSVPSTPVAMFQFNSSCVNTATQFTDLSSAPGSQLSSWFWEFGDGIGTSNLQNPLYTYTTAGTYNVKLKVTNLNGCPDSITIPVISRPTPLADYNFNNFYCPAGQVIFHDQSQPNGTNIAERLWIFEPGSTSTLHDPTYVFPVTDTSYLVTLIVTDDYGCKDTTIKSVYVKPAVSFTFINDISCFGNPTQFHSYNNNPGDSLYFIQWNFGDPASGNNNTSTLHDPTHVFSSPNNYIVKLKAWNSDNCADSVYRTVVVHALPAPDYSVVSPPCDNLTTFTDISSAGNGTISSWSWNFGDGTPVQTIFAPGPGNTSHVYDFPGTYLVSLRVTDNNECADILTKPVERPACIISSFIQADPGACSGSPVTFTDNSTPVNQINHWLWDFGDGSDTSYFSYSGTVQHSFSVPGNYNVILTIYAGINGQSFMDTTGAQVSVKQSPLVSFSGTTACLNQINIFRDQSNTFGADILSWKWSFDDPSSGTNNSSALSDPSHQYHALGVYNVSLKVINKFGCKDSIRKPTSVFAKPQAKFISTLACSDNPTYFFDRSVEVDTTVGEWHWNFGVSPAKKDTSTLRDPVYKYKKEGHYDVFLIIRDNHGCYDTMDSVITVKPSPLSAFILTDNISNTADKIQVKNKSERADTYFWDFGNGFTSTEENPFVTYKEDGTYLIMLVSSNNFGCSDTSYYKYDLLFKGLFVPNAFAPTTDILGVNQFKPVGVNLERYKIEVFDSWGNMVWQSSSLDSEGRPTEGWNGRKNNGDLYQQGTYMWKINATFMDGSVWEGSDIGKGAYKSIGTVTLIR
jgi:PKD repeat protein